MLRDSFIIKIRPKFVASQPGEQPIAIHILTIISRRKENQTTNFFSQYGKTGKEFSLKNKHKIQWLYYSQTLF